MLTERSYYNNHTDGYHYRSRGDRHFQQHHNHDCVDDRDRCVPGWLQEANSVNNANLCPLVDTVTISQTETDTVTSTAATTTSTVPIPDGFIVPTPTSGGKKRGLSPAVQANAMVKKSSEIHEARAAIAFMPPRCKGAKTKYPYKVVCTQLVSL
jgi:hypothetical protein